MGNKTSQSNRFIARAYHDTGKFARTLNEAFGPYAELHVERRHWLDRTPRWVVVLLVAVVLVAYYWSVTK